MSDLPARLEELLAEAEAAGELAAIAGVLEAWSARAGQQAPLGAEPDHAAEWPGRFGIVAESAVMRAVFETIERAATSDLPVLVRGETGTGKELVARALHDASPRRKGPFVAENCAALPANLLESELFGHRRGSFTGAVADSLGQFRAAEGGTLFLDEVGEMPLELQSKLLRALDQGCVRPVGGEAPVPIDVRFVAATNRDLAQMVEEKRFRADLLYRINVMQIELPPLRDRNGDIELLARYFLLRAAQRSLAAGRRPPASGEGAAPGIRAEVLEALGAYAWPGNIRQLQNEIERALALAAGGEITLDLLSRELAAPSS